ncbi:MAG: hypothetical protein L0228_04810 [Planctomycetes bacterium]|nr:hypothetical protein [Planctomycetota bacterium]
MSKYLLTCQCGNTVPVEVGQAGDRVTCVCGAQLDVPTLRKLRHLPVERPAASQARAAWNPRKGFVAASLIAAGLLVASAVWTWLKQPVVPKFDPVAQLNAADAHLAKITPAESWMRWVAVYLPLANSGFAVFEHPDKDAIEQQVAQYRILETTLLIIAASCVTVALIAAFRPRPRGI